MTFQFQTPIFLVGEGELPKAQFDLLYSSKHPVIAADGGANHLRQFDIIPHCVIGDMDSLQDRAYFEAHSTVLHLEDQDSTDLEKCLNEVEAPLFLALGFIGKRFDHTLEILHILQKYTHKNIVFFSNEDVIVRLPAKCTFELPKGTRLSLYPLKETSVLKSEGLKYPLNGLVMKQGALIGTSNEVHKAPVRIEQEDESLIGIFPMAHSLTVLTSLFTHHAHGLIPS